MPIIKEENGEFVYELGDDETYASGSEFESETEFQNAPAKARVKTPPPPPKPAVQSPRKPSYTKNNVVAPVKESNTLVRQQQQPSRQQQTIRSPALSNYSYDDEEKNLLDNENRNKDNFCLRKDCGSCPNVCHIILATCIGLCALTIFGLILGKYVMQQNANSNAPKGQSGNFVSEICTTSRDCTFGAVCTSGKCQCTLNSYFDTFFGKCLPLKSYGASCLENRECDQFNRLVCFQSKCTCPLQSVWGNYYGTFECVRTREVGETCQDTLHCVNTSRCIYTDGNYRCSCYYASDMFLSGSSGQCEPTLKVNQRCFGWYQECPKNTTCRSSNNGDSTTFCLCTDGNYYDTNSDTCIPYQGYNAYCDSHYPCYTTLGLRCSANLCKCPSGQFFNGTYCQAYQSYGEICSASLPCLTSDPNLVCGIPPNGISQAVCYCNTNYYFDEYLGSCTLLKSEGSYCSESAECVDYAFCNANVCVCVAGYWFNPTTGACETQLIYGDACVSSPDSKPCNNLMYGIDCYNSACSCHPSYEYWDSTYGYCQPRRHYQESCSTTNVCAAYRGLTCISSTCSCQSPLSWSTTYNWCI